MLSNDVTLTILKRRDRFTFLAVLTVPYVISGFYSELVGCEGLQPWGRKHREAHQSS